MKKTLLVLLITLLASASPASTKELKDYISTWARFGNNHSHTIRWAKSSHPSTLEVRFKVLCYNHEGFRYFTVILPSNEEVKVAEFNDCNIIKPTSCTGGCGHLTIHNVKVR